MHCLVGLFQPGIAAACKQACTDVVRCPAPALLQKLFQHRQCRPIGSVVAKLPCIIVLLPRRKSFAGQQQFLINVQIPVRVAGVQFPVGHCRIAVADTAGGHHGFMYGSGETIAAAPPENPFPPGDHLGRSGSVKAEPVREKYHVCFRSLQDFSQLFVVFPLDDIVRVQPQPVISYGLGNGVVPCRGKIVAPRKIINFGGIFRSHCLGVVGGAGVHQNDLIYQICHRIQTPPQHRFFISHDHAKTDQRHMHSSFCWFIVCGRNGGGAGFGSL